MARNMIDDVPVGTIQVDEILPDKSKLTRTISGIGTPNITRNYTPPGTINQDVVSAGAERIAASTRRSLSPTASNFKLTETRLTTTNGFNGKGYSPYCSIPYRGADFLGNTW